MRNVRDILRLHTEHHLAGRQIAQSLGLSHSTVMSVLHRAEALGLSWPLPVELDDATLEGKLYPPAPGERGAGGRLCQMRGLPDWLNGCTGKALDQERRPVETENVLAAAAEELGDLLECPLHRAAGSGT